MKQRISVVMGLLIMVTMVSLSFKPDNWRILGTKTVDYQLDKDVLDVQLRDGVFQKLKFVVRGGALNMHKVIVHFENGGEQEIDMRHSFDKNSQSRVIDLKGNKRIIEKIVFWYDTKNASNRKEKVTVLGR